MNRNYRYRPARTRAIHVVASAIGAANAIIGLIVIYQRYRRERPI